MQLNFSAFDYDPTQGGSICFPLADYKVEITSAEPKVVKDNPNAGYLELSLTVTEGELRGMVQKDRLNIFHTSEVAKRIAHQSLAAYCFAINRPYVQDSAQLIGGRCICTIGPQTDDSKYSEVKMIKCMDGSMPTKPVQPAQAPGAPQPPQAPVPSQPPLQPQQPIPQAPQAPPAMSQPQYPVASGPSAPPWNTPAAPAPSWAQASPPPPPPNSAPGGLPPWAKQ
jgi:hypothetical protein